MTDKEKIASLERELREARSKLNDFMYVVSHDLKEPVRGMKNYINFTVEDFPDDLPEEALENLNNAVVYGDRFDLMMDRLLLFSRLNTVNHVFEDIDILEIIEGVLDFEGLKETSVVRGSSVLNVDAKLIKLLVEEIVSNAVLYNTSESKSLEVSIINIGNETRVEFKDNGIGIEEKYFVECFRAFSRLNGKNKFGNASGMGLSLVKQIMEIHNGEVNVSSKYGESTTITLIFKNIE